jgi:hypothetical protein
MNININPISQNLLNIYNNCNYYIQRPWILLDDNKIFINKEWFEKQNELFSKTILELLNKNNIDMINMLPQNYEASFVMNELETKIYNLYLYNFNYSVWYSNEIISDVTIINLDSEKIREICINCLYCNKLFDVEILKLQNDYDKIENALDKYNDYVFVRLDQRSAKKDYGIIPLNNTKDILHHLIFSKSLYKNVYNKNLDVKLIIMPWKNIKKKYEFRIFIYNKNVVAISQQHLYNKFKYDVIKIHKIITLINNSNFIKKLPYNDVVCDVYIDIINNLCNLIDCKPYGAYSSSRSSLFCWVKDKNVLCQNNSNIEFRFQV